MPNNDMHEVVIHLGQADLDYLGITNASDPEASAIIRQRLFEAMGAAGESINRPQEDDR